MTRRRLLRALVPKAWTGDEALYAARLLRDALDVVWEVHGEHMAAALAERPSDTWSAHFADDIDADGPTDESPF